MSPERAVRLQPGVKPPVIKARVSVYHASLARPAMLRGFPENPECPDCTICILPALARRVRGGELRPMREKITHFDLFPSLLSALGFTVEGGRLGFGYDVFSREAVPPANHAETLRKRVLSHSRVYESLWLPEYAEGKASE